MDNSPVKIWRNQKHIKDLLGKTGHVVSFTTIRVPPNGFADFAPYIVVIVKFSNKLQFTGQLVDSDSVKIGMKAVAVLRRTKTPQKEGIIPYGIKFKPISDL